jgi:hypothetical protein
MRSEHRDGPQKRYDTIQELFNDIYTRMVEQGEPSRIRQDDESACSYRGQDDTACAIGIVLTDATCKFYNLVHLNPTLKSDDYSAEACVIRDTLFSGELTPEKCIFLSEMQSCHDDSPEDTFLESFKQKASEVAKRFRITIPLV